MVAVGSELELHFRCVPLTPNGWSSWRPASSRALMRTSCPDGSVQSAWSPSMIATMTPTHGVCLAAADEHISLFGFQARLEAGEHESRGPNTTAVKSVMLGICLTVTDEPEQSP